MRPEIAGSVAADSRRAGREHQYRQGAGYRHLRCAENARAGLARHNPEKRLQARADRGLSIKERRFTNRRRNKTAVWGPPLLGSDCRLLLRQAMEGAEAPDQLGAIDRDDTAFREKSCER